MNPGQEVVCIKKGPWVTVYGPDPIRTGPEFNEIVTVKKQHKDSDGAWEFLTFEEYPENQGYSSSRFRPVFSQEDIANAIENIEICEVSGQV